MPVWFSTFAFGAEETAPLIAEAQAKVKMKPEWMAETETMAAAKVEAVTEATSMAEVEEDGSKKIPKRCTPSPLRLYPPDDISSKKFL